MSCVCILRVRARAVFANLIIYTFTEQTHVALMALHIQFAAVLMLISKFDVMKADD